MKKQILCFFYAFFLLFSTHASFSQTPLDKASIEQQLRLGLNYLEFYRDSAEIILDRLYIQLEEQEGLSTPQGLRIRIGRAKIMQIYNQREEATDELLKIIEESEASELPEIYARAQYDLAKLYASLGSGNAIRHLVKADSVRALYQLEHLYPEYALQIAHLAFARHLFEMAQEHLHEVFEKAPKYKQWTLLADAHFLSGKLFKDSLPSEAEVYFKKAAHFYRQQEKWHLYSGVVNELSLFYLDQGKTDLALIYNDSALYAEGLIQEYAINPYNVSHHFNKGRGKILQALGQYDSAFHYLEASYEKSLESYFQLNHDKIVAVEERYKDEKKAQLIKEQEQRLTLEQNRRYALLSIIGIILLFSSLLIFFYQRLRKANQKTKEQALIIKQTNEELAASLEQQILLQGEIHHRVKNNLQVLISLLELQSEEIEDEKALKSLDAMGKRIYSIAAIHEILHQKQGTKMVNLLEYTQNLCKHFSNFLIEQDRPLFSIDIDNRSFNIETLMPLGIILNELLTNSLKYAKKKSKQLQIAISLKKQDDGYLIHYRDNGPGFPKGALKEREGGLGTYLLKSMSRQLNGYMESKNEEGATYQIFFKEKNSHSQMAA